MAGSVSLTEQLQMFMRGDTAATDALLRQVLPKLHEIAVRELKRERYVPPLSKTELIHEVWLSSLSRGGWQIHDRGHFFALEKIGFPNGWIAFANHACNFSRRGCQGKCVQKMPIFHFQKTCADIHAVCAGRLANQHVVGPSKLSAASHSSVVRR